MSDYNQTCLKVAEELDVKFDNYQQLLKDLSKDFDKAMESESEDFVGDYWKNYVNTSCRELRKQTKEVTARVNEAAAEHLEVEREHKKLANINEQWGRKMNRLAQEKHEYVHGALNERHNGLLSRGSQRADGTYEDLRKPLIQNAIETETIRRRVEKEKKEQAAREAHAKECPKCAACCKNAKEEPIGKVFAEKAKNLFEYLLEQGAAIGYDNDLYVLLANAIQGAIQLKWAKILETGISA